MFPKVFYLNRGEAPKIIYLDQNDKVIIEAQYEPKTEQRMLGLLVSDVIFLYPQGNISKAFTLFHEFLHWINQETLSWEWIDNLIDQIL